MKSYFFAACLLLLLPATLAVHTFKAFRMAQYDKGSTQLGSRRATVNFLASGPQVSDLSRKVALLRMQDIHNGTLEEVLDGKRAGGLLIITPSSLKDIDRHVLNAWRQFEQVLLSREVAVPVYFAQESQDLRYVYDQVLKFTSEGKTLGAASSEGYQIVVSGSEASRIPTVPTANIEGLVEGTASVNADGEGLPIIAIVAHYDTFAVAPALSSGTDSNGSGVVALLELARLFSRLYSSSRTQGKYNLVLLLTGGGRLNYAGSRHWLNNADPRLTDRIEMALCLDSIGMGGPLNVHTSKPPKEAEVQRLLEALRKGTQQVTGDEDPRVNLVHKKVNVSSPEVAWEHENFSRKRVFAATLSRFSSPTGALARGSIFDSRELLDLPALMQNIHIIAEAIAKHIYGLHGQNVTIFEGSLAPSAEFVSSWLQTLSSIPRISPLLSKDSETVSALTSVMKEAVGEGSVKVHDVRLDTDVVFYDKLVAEVKAFRVKPITFHMLLLLLSVLYLVGLFVALKGPSEMYHSVVDSFSPRGEKKRQ